MKKDLLQKYIEEAKICPKEKLPDLKRKYTEIIIKDWHQYIKENLKDNIEFSL